MLLGVGQSTGSVLATTQGIRQSTGMTVLWHLRVAPMFPKVEQPYHFVLEGIQDHWLRINLSKHGSEEHPCNVRHELLSLLHTRSPTHLYMRMFFCAHPPSPWKNHRPYDWELGVATNMRTALGNSKHLHTHLRPRLQLQRHHIDIFN